MEKFTDNTPLPFAINRKHKGKKLANVPAQDLLGWFYGKKARQSDASRKLEDYIRENLDVLQMEID